MAKYTSDTNLIRGAATAYKNYDNMPGMYAGLDKITEAGMGMVGEAVKGFEAEKKKQEEETKAAEAEKKRQDNNWYDISGAVYENAGSFMKDVEYKDTVSQLTALKPRLIAARKSGNPEEIAAVMTEFNNIKSDVDGHKAFRETITNPEYGISNAMKHSGIEPGDNGEDHNFLTGLVGEDYKITREGGQTYYNVGGVKKTMKEIKDMTILKDNIPYAAYGKAVNDFSKAKNFDRDNTEYHVRNNVIPQQTNGLRAFLADDGFGNGETFSQVLNRKGNRASIEKEIMNSAFNADGGGIDDKEWANFTNAIVDPKNEFWKGDEEAWKKESTRIATEQLTNGIENKWIANQPDQVKAGGQSGQSGPDQFFLGKQYIPAAAVTPDVNILNEDPKDIPARTAWNQAIFRKVNGQYQVYQDDAFVDVTKEQLRTTLEFSEKVGYDMSGAGGGKTPPKTPEVPADFNKAFRDDEKKVVQYFKNNPSLYPGMKVERTTSDDPEDGNDTFRITMPSGTSKVFTADPFVGDENKIKDTWTWINSNYENNEFAQ